MRIRVQVFDDQKFLTSISQIKIIFFFEEEKNAIYRFFIPKSLWRTSKLQAKQKIAFITSEQYRKFFHFFLFLWVIFAHLNPDPDPADQNQCWSGSTTLFKTIHFFIVSMFCGSFLPTLTWMRILIQPAKINADPDPRHWLQPSLLPSAITAGTFNLIISTVFLSKSFFSVS